MNLPAMNYSLSSIVEGGYCIGCGSCASLQNSPINIQLNAAGKYQAKINDVIPVDLEQKILKVCPFSNTASNEDEIGHELFSADAQHDAHLGYWQESYIGHVAEAEYRANGSSGGFVSWLICELMSRGEIDGVLHVVPTVAVEGSEVFFKYGVSTKEDEVRAGAKSRYYGVEMSQALKFVRETPGKYLVVGIPCFIKSIRLLSKAEPLFSERIVFSVAILCGHLKSIGYLEFIAWQMGVPLGQIKAFDFRHKMPGNPAKNYAAEITYHANGQLKRQANLMREFKGEDWGMGLFKYSACDYCDDVMGETADVSAGDAWIEPYSSDSHGTNVIVVRNKYLHNMIESARESKKLQFERVTPELAAQTQEASFRHRRDGLAYRLWLKQQQGKWAPNKRVLPDNKHLSKKYKRIFKLRKSLVELSDQACLKARSSKDFSLYWPQVKSTVNRYHRCYNPLWIAVPRKLWRVIVSKRP
jgi:coenzyme F420 hydrogenase subunit beta